MLHRFALALAVSALACSSGATKKADPPAKVKKKAAPKAALIGDACETETMFGQGTCAAGQACLPTPGGYCSAPCGFEDCPQGSVCAQGPRAGDICVAACESDDDCRGDAGYTCDLSWNACVLPGLVGPVPPSCPDLPAPPRAKWSAPVQISTDKSPGAYQFEPAAGLTKNGSVAALFITNGVRTTETKSPFPNVLASSVVAKSGEVSADHEFPTESENHFDPWVARGRDGTLHAVWLGFDGGMAPEKNMVIGYSTTTDGLEWTAPRAVQWAADCPEGADGCLDKPMIAIGPRHDKKKADAIYVFYYSQPRGGLVVTRSIDDGATFEESVLVGEAAYADAEVDSNGALYVAYADSSPGEFSSAEGRIKMRWSPDGGKSFSEPKTVSAEGESIPFYFSNPQIVPDPARKRVSVVYPTGDATGAWNIVFATSTDRGATWTRIVANDDGTCASHMTPAAVLIEKTGEVQVAWTENRGGAGRIVAARCNPKKGSCAANEQVSDEDFAAYTFARHSPTWLGEYFTLIAEGKAKRLHAVWTQPVSEDDRAVGRIFWAWRPL